MKKYGKFAAMIATSTLVMFGLMYLNTYAWDHVWFSETRTYMAFVMGAAMAIVMLLYMLDMYSNWKVNIGILAVALAAGARVRGAHPRVGAGEGAMGAEDRQQPIARLVRSMLPYVASEYFHTSLTKGKIQAAWAGSMSSSK